MHYVEFISSATDQFFRGSNENNCLFFELNKLGSERHDGCELPNIKTSSSLYGSWEAHVLSDESPSK